MINPGIGNTNKEYDVVILGSGPGGCTAAIYAVRARLKTVMLDKVRLGGPMASTDHVANYPGFPETMRGAEILQAMKDQAANLGAEFAQTEVFGVDFSTEPKQIFTAEGTYTGKAVIVATGASQRKTRIQGEEEYLGRGVSYCATCDAAFYVDHEVAVVGDSDEAAEEALHLAKFAKVVHIMAPRRQLMALPAVAEEVLQHPKISVHFATSVREIVGDTAGVTGLIAKERGGDYGMLAVTGAFVYMLGSLPATGFLQGALATDDKGYIKVDELMQASVPGVYAIGDVRSGPIKQIVTAAADGAVAAMSADRFINKRAAVTSLH